MKNRIAIAADHGGFFLKNDLLQRLGSVYTFIDLGAEKFDSSDDYPDYAYAVAREVAAGRTGRGILVCGSGVGACIAANKMKGVRACVCHDTYSAHQGVEHDDMNILCLGSRIVGVELAVELVNAFLTAKFKNEGRYLRRLKKIITLENQSFK
jgi:ribose 5-phosphate isomerase B